MPTSFHRSLQSLRADNGIRSNIAILVAVMLGAAWLTWALKASVTRYETSESARLEVVGAAYPLQANLAGRLASSSLVLGKEVRAGDVLAELDAAEARLSLGEEEARLNSLAPQIEALHLQMQAEERGGTDDKQVLGLSVAAAEAQVREAQAQASLAEKEAERSNRLRTEGIISEADYQRAQADAKSKRAAAETLQVTLSRLTPEEQLRTRDREVREKQVLEQIAKLQADEETSRAAIRRLNYEVERRLIRAPISGRLGECAQLRPGSHLSEGQQLGVILPSGKVQVVAEFDPSAALGKVRPGQTAIVRLQGFPWTQFGTIRAVVSRVASDIRDNKIRVELAVKPGNGSRIPFQHGLPGSVEVEIEHVSPLALVLRAAGRLVGAH